MSDADRVRIRAEEAARPKSYRHQHPARTSQPVLMGVVGEKMRRIAAVISLLLIAATFAGASRGGGGSVHVSGYTTKNGTVVAPYYRSAPGSGSGSYTSSGTGIPCGNSYIAATDVCHIGTPSSTYDPVYVAQPVIPMFTSCAEARAAGRSNFASSDPAYQPELDRDNDGIACESGEESATYKAAPAAPNASSSMPIAATPDARYVKTGDLTGLSILTSGMQLNLGEKTLTFANGSLKAQMKPQVEVVLKASPFVLNGEEYVPVDVFNALGCSYIGQSTIVVTCGIWGRGVQTYLWTSAK